MSDWKQGGSTRDRFDVAWRTPLLHGTHRYKCGCATTQTSGRILVCECGAGYEEWEVLTFQLWDCYDCGDWRPVGLVTAKPSPGSAGKEGR